MAEKGKKAVAAAAAVAAGASATTTASAPPRGCCGKYFKTIAFTWLLMVALFFLTVAGLLQFEGGRETIASLHCKLQEPLALTPLEHRDAKWRVMESVVAIAFGLPLLLANGGERLKVFHMYAQACGPTFPFRGGVAYTTYDMVHTAMTNPQERGHFIGASKMADECMGVDTLIFLSDGPKHKAARELIKRAIKGFVVDFDAPPPPPPAVAHGPKSGASTANATEREVTQTMVATIYNRMFGVPPSEALLPVLMEYVDAGKLCILPVAVHHLMGNKVLKQVTRIRHTVKDELATTPGGKSLLEECRKSGLSQAESDAMLLQLADGFMFAGMIGTSHLTWRTVQRIRGAPHVYAPLYKRDPYAFLMEQARVDPPVTSVTMVAARDTHLRIGRSQTRDAVLPKGATVQIILSEANRDAAVFGGPSRSQHYADTFHPSRGKDQHMKIFSWNGEEAAVRAKLAPRGCLGHDLSLSVAKQIVDAYLPTEEEIKAAHFTCQGETCVTQREGGKQVSTEFSAFELFDRVGYVAWLLCAGAGMLYLFFFTDMSAMAQHYAVYLGGQWWVAVGFLFTAARPAYYLGRIVSALAYYVLYIDYKYRSFKDPQQQQLRAFRIWAIYVVAAAYFATLLAVFYVYGSSFPVAVVSNMTIVFYSFAALAALATIVRAWIDSGFQRVFTIAVVGGCFGIANLFWPALLPAEYFNLASRLADSFLYVPLVLGCMQDLDELMVKQGKLAPPALKPGVTVAPSGAAVKPRSWGRFFYISVLLLALVAGQFTSQKSHSFGDGQLCPYLEPEQQQQQQGDSASPSSSSSLSSSTPAAAAALSYTDPRSLSASDRALCKSSTHLSSIEDMHLRFWYRIVHGMNVEYDKEDAPSPSDVPAPFVPKKPLRKQVLHFGARVPTEDDEDFPLQSFKNHVQEAVTVSFGELMKTSSLFPVRDFDKPWDNVEEARAVMRLAAQGLPPNNKDWQGIDMKGDEALAHIAFSGVAAHHLVKRGSRFFNETLPEYVRALTSHLNATYVLWFDWMQGLEVRHGFERYGATLFLDDKGKPLGIHCPQRPTADIPAGSPALVARLVTPKHKDWEHAKFVWRSSAVVGVTLADHLVGVHLMMSNFVVMAQRESFEPDHPIRRFLKPFSFRSFSINKGAAQHLVDKHGILHHAVALSWEGMKSGFKFAYSLHRFFKIPDYLAMRGIDAANPLHTAAQDLLAFHAIAERLVRRYVALYYPTEQSVLGDEQLRDFFENIHVLPDSRFSQLRSREDLVTLLTNYIVAVTAVHHHVGNVAEYLTDATVASGKLRPGRYMADVQASFQAILIALLTGRKQPPLIGDWTHVLLDDAQRPEAAQALKDFNAELLKLSDEIRAKNKQRPYPTNAFDPRLMLSSVSI